MIIDPNLYKQEDSEVFSLNEGIKKIFNEFSLSGLVRGQVAILNTTNLNKLNLLGQNGVFRNVPGSCITISLDSAINKHGIYVAQCHLEQKAKLVSESVSYEQVCLRILNVEYFWLLKFFKWIDRYLSKRISDGRILTMHDVMRISLATVIEGLHLIKVILDDSWHQASQNLFFIAALIEETTKKLSDCAGGRSFVGGNILEFYWVTVLLNQFLFGEIK